MQIKKLDIYGYGKWVDQSFELDQGLQVFLGQNEAGKSTLMSFIHSILFGFPTRNSIFLRYEPQESSKYGGRIIADDRLFGELMIERVHGKVTGDVTVTLEDGTTGSDELLEQILKGISRENYQSIFSFSLSDIEDVHRLDKNKLSRYLLNIGAHSTDYYLDLVDEFEKKAYDLYRPSGRIPPLNKELATIADQERKLERLEKRNQSYLNFIEKYEKQSEEIEEIEVIEETLEKKLKDLREFKKELHILREIQTLENEIAAIRLPILKKDGPYLIGDYKKEINEINNRIDDLKTQMELEQETFLNPELIEKYEENKKEIADLEQDLPEMIEKVNQLRTIEEKLRERDIQFLTLKKELKIERQTNIPIYFSEKDKQQVANWHKSSEQLEKKIASITLEIQELEYQLNLKNQRADQYEEMMWDNQYLKDVENKIHRNKDDDIEKETQKNTFALSLGAVGFFIILVSFMVTSFNQSIGYGLGFILLTVSAFSYQKNSKKKAEETLEDDASNEMLINEYNKQVQVKSNWQLLLGEIDSIQEIYQGKKEDKSRLSKQQDLLAEDWARLLISHNIPTIHVFEESDQVMNNVNELNNIKDEITELNDQYESLANQLEQQESMIDEIIGERNLNLTDKINHFRLYLRELNQLLRTEQVKIDQLNTIKEKGNELVTERERIKNKIKNLLEATGAQTEEEFLEFYDKKEKRDRKKSRVQFLKENVPAFDSNKKLPSKEELFEKEEKITEDLTELHKEMKLIINERANTQVNIKNLEKDGSYSEALQAFENQKASVQGLVDEWISDKLAASIIQTTLNQVTKERFEEIMEKINDYFNFLTDGEYEKVLFRNDELFVQKKEGSVMPVKVLSRGTAEPLYVAIRLAYIVKMQDITKLPIVIDDPFVNFDQRRKTNVYRLLDQLSEQLQIIYFSFDEELKEVFDSKKIMELDKM